MTSYGMLSVGGVICLTLGSVMLFNTGTPGLRISWSVLIPAVLVISGFFMTVAFLAVRAHMARPRTGYQGLIGEIAVAKESSGAGRQGVRPRGTLECHLRGCRSRWLEGRGDRGGKFVVESAKNR